MSMLVVGSVATDTIHNPSGTFPKVLGGSATYAALAGSLFTKVHLVGVVGTDFPPHGKKALADKGVDLTGLEESKDGLTFHWEGRYSDDLSSRESLKTELNVFASFQPKIPAVYQTMPYLMLGNIDPELQSDVLRQMKETRLVIADTMNFWISGKPNELAALLKKIDLLVVNEEEARQLAGTQNIVKASRELLKMGPSKLVIKRGEYGAMLFEDGEMFSAPAYPCEEVLDPTGAGDTFAGGLLGYLAKENAVSGDALRRAVIYGSAAASFCVEGISIDRLLTVTNDEIKERYRAFARLAHFATPAELG